MATRRKRNAQPAPDPKPTVEGKARKPRTRVKASPKTPAPGEAPHADPAAEAHGRARLGTLIWRALLVAFRDLPGFPSEGAWTGAFRWPGFTTQRARSRDGGSVLVTPDTIKGKGREPEPEIWTAVDTDRTVDIATRMLVTGTLAYCGGRQAVNAKGGKPSVERARELLKGYGMKDRDSEGFPKSLKNAVFGAEMLERWKEVAEALDIPERHAFGFHDAEPQKARKRAVLAFLCGGFEEGSPCYGKQGRVTLTVQGINGTVLGTLNLSDVRIPCRTHVVKVKGKGQAKMADRYPKAEARWTNKDAMK